MLFSKVETIKVESVKQLEELGFNVKAPEAFTAFDLNKCTIQEDEAGLFPFYMVNRAEADLVNMGNDDLKVYKFRITWDWHFTLLFLDYEWPTKIHDTIEQAVSDGILALNRVFRNADTRPLVDFSYYGTINVCHCRFFLVSIYSTSKNLEDTAD